MPTRTQAIKSFLEAQTLDDLAILYSHDMECQVNVSQDGGEKVEGDYKGRTWVGWTDGIQSWKPFRIPYKAYSEPEYIDTEIKFDLAEHAEGIGLTGWDWKNRLSRWVAFDFDGLIDHKQGLTEYQLEEVRKTACNIPWVTVRHSTSGKGLHIYIFIKPTPTANHNEHSALARSILGKMSALTGFDFQSKVDACGGNMWIWHRKMKGTNGLTLIKRGGELEDIPENWRDHIKVLTTKKKMIPEFVQQDSLSIFDELVSNRIKIPLDESHKAFIHYLEDNNCQWWWDSDNHILISHTIHLKEAHEALSLKGIFETISVGSEHGTDHNCFCSPLRNGAWSVRRYTLGVQEANTWTQDEAGWTQCFFNKEPDLKTAAKRFGGIELETGGFEFRQAELAARAAESLGAILELPNWALARKSILKLHKDGRIIANINREATDMPIEGWLASKKDSWTKIFPIRVGMVDETDTRSYDNIVRHIVSETGEDLGWVLRITDQSWSHEPLPHIRVALKSFGFPLKDVDKVLGGSVYNCWKLVNLPFKPEYPGGRMWNRYAAQLRFLPSVDKDNLTHPTWDSILRHVGTGLDEAIKSNVWAKINGINTGEDYLKVWLASLFQEPTEPVPYLFLWGPQGSGKSILHEAISLLLTRGYQRADSALKDSSLFNAELENALVCVIEETDLGRSKMAYNKIKDWVTARQLLIHPKNRTPYHSPNYTHWIQCSNNADACPIFPGDTRITMIYVDMLPLKDLIPKKIMITRLEKEAPDFLASIAAIELPQSNDRLNVPVILTEDKISVQKKNQTALEMYIDENCFYVEGSVILFSDFYDSFNTWLDPNSRFEWSKIKVGRAIDHPYQKGRDIKDNQVYIVNMSFEKSEALGPKIAIVNEHFGGVKND
jgi:hypothetical protein